MILQPAQKPGCASPPAGFRSSDTLSTGPKPRPKVHKRPGEVPGALGDPIVELAGSDPAPLTDLLRIQFEGPFGLTAINPDKLVAGLRAGRFLEDPPKVARLMEPDFLTELTKRGGPVILPTVDMAGAGTDPFPRGGILAHRPALEEELPPLVKDQHVNRPMKQPVLMDDRPGGAADDLIVQINHIKMFGG